jgi:hypothetical protein
VGAFCCFEGDLGIDKTYVYGLRFGNELCSARHFPTRRIAGIGSMRVDRFRWIPIVQLVDFGLMKDGLHRSTQSLIRAIHLQASSFRSAVVASRLRMNKRTSSCITFKA